jgi:hypothetical protein
MDYSIRRHPEDLESTGFVEIGPGRYTGKHWQEGFIFVWEDAFGMAEGIIARHLQTYDHLSPNDIHRTDGRSIIDDWRKAAALLPNFNPTEAHTLLNVEATYGTSLVEEVANHQAEIGRFLGQLADDVERFYRHSEWVCILGV